MTRSGPSSTPRSEPRQATPRNPERETHGPYAAVFARLSGRRMPRWARDAVDVAGELDADGRYAYPIVVVTVPRQSAKTTTVLDVALGRGLMLPTYWTAYAAQTGHVTTERFADRFTELEASELAPYLKIRRSAGTERVTIRSNGSYVKAFPPKDGALRSSALDLVVVDEGQEHADEPLGVALDHTIMPTLTTRPRRQLWILGTAPALPGTYLERYAALARAGAPGVALVDYGATEDEDPADPATWRRRHPGLEAGLTDEDYLRQQYELDPAGFTREHLNVWPRSRPGAVIPAAAWEAAALDARPPVGAVVRLGLDVAPGEAGATVCASWATDTGAHVAVVQSGPGTAWLDAALPELTARYGQELGYDSISAAAGVVARLRLPGARPLTFGDVSAACAWVREALLEDPPRLTVTPDPELDRAAAAAVKRTVGDSGRWVWGRRDSGVPIHPLVAATCAAWLVAAPPLDPFLV